MYHEKIVLENGLRIISVPMKENPAVTVLVMVEAGSKYESKEINGLSHFLEHMCFKGTLKRPKAIDISRELDSIGSQYNAFTAQEYTGYYAKSHPKYLKKILDVVADMYLNPVFDEHEIEKEKGVIIEEINMYEDMPHRHVQDLFMDLLYGDQPAGWNIAGTKEVVNAMRRDDFIAYRNNQYVAEATTVIVAGNFDQDKIAKIVQSAFKGISKSPKKPKIDVIEKQDQPAMKLKFKETDQTHLVLGVRACSINDPRVPILRVLKGVLGGGMSSRLFQRLRDEMGVGYYVHASSDLYTDHGAFIVSTGVDTTRVSEVITAIIDELKKLKSEPVPDSELKKVKDYLIGNLYLGLESSDSVAEFYGFQDVLRRPLQTPEQMVKRIKKVTAAEIQEVAESFFQNKNLNLALIGRTVDEKQYTDVLRF